jgi:hypothetical protein
MWPSNKYSLLGMMMYLASNARARPNPQQPRWSEQGKIDVADWVLWNMPDNGGESVPDV